MIFAIFYLLFRKDFIVFWGINKGIGDYPMPFCLFIKKVLVEKFLKKKINAEL